MGTTSTTKTKNDDGTYTVEKTWTSDDGREKVTDRETYKPGFFQNETVSKTHTVEKK